MRVKLLTGMHVAGHPHNEGEEIDLPEGLRPR